MSDSELSSLRSASPECIPVQPDHFYGQSSPPSPRSDKGYYDPEDDLLATRGIPVFCPPIEEFQDFEGYVNKIECWGMKSGIVKIIPPKEWTAALPSTVPQLASVKLRNPIEQEMVGRGGLFRQQNVEKRRVMSVREWAELCAKDDMRAPTVAEAQGGRRKAAPFTPTRSRRRRGETVVKQQGAAEDDAKEDIEGDPLHSGGHSEGDAIIEDSKPEDYSPMDPASTLPTPPPATTPSDTTPSATTPAPTTLAPSNTPAKPSAIERKEAKEALDTAFLASFDPHKDWLPHDMRAEDYTPDFCRALERIYWRNCGLGRAPWYGADMKGSLFTNATQHWNVAKLPSVLSRLLGNDAKISGVNTPYLYFGMWRATFAWHVEDMDLFSINYIHFGSPKHWYAVPQGRSQALETTMKGYFPRDNTTCPQFLRHKSFLASPSLLSQSSVRPNVLVQHAGEFVITFPRGYHAGFNLGLNCAESVNFALDSWVEMGLKAAVCMCEADSVRIDVRGLLEEKERREREGVVLNPEGKEKKSAARKRKVEVFLPYGTAFPSKPKKLKLTKPKPKALPASPESLPPNSSTQPKPKPKPPKTISKSKPPPADQDQNFAFPCCLCASTSVEGLLRVHDPPPSFSGVVRPPNGVYRAHEACARVVPETWVDDDPAEGITIEGGVMKMEQVVWGVDGIVKDRWMLKCAACPRPRAKVHGAPIQCTKGKCSKAFHVSCASGTNLDAGGNGVSYRVIEELEKEVVLLEPEVEAAPPPPNATASMDVDRPQPPPAMDGMAVDGAPPSFPASTSSTRPLPPRLLTKDGPRVIKTIKKFQVEVLCSQHNPVRIAQKKANKDDQARRDLAALPEMSRICIRNSSGVLEVSLVKVWEDRRTVEVLWDGGQRREFKWGSIVWGGVGQTTGSKPSVEDLATQPRPVPPPLAPGSSVAAGPVPPPMYVPAPNQQPYSSHTHAGQAPFPAATYAYTPVPPARAGPPRPQYQGMSQFRAAPQPVQGNANQAPSQPSATQPSWNPAMHGYNYMQPPPGYVPGAPQYHGYYPYPYYHPQPSYAPPPSASPQPSSASPPTGPVAPPHAPHYAGRPFLPLAPQSVKAAGAGVSKSASPVQSSGQPSMPAYVTQHGVPPQPSSSSS